MSWLGTLAGPVRTACEAGPTGHGLARALEDAGIACLVAAPGRIPRASGERVKNDRRDAERLARLLRAGEPVAVAVAVAVPTIADEGARDLVRAREDARADLMRARHRLSKVLLRHGRIYDEGAWSAAHDARLRRQRLEVSSCPEPGRGERAGRPADAARGDARLSDEQPPGDARSQRAPRLRRNTGHAVATPRISA